MPCDDDEKSMNARHRTWKQPRTPSKVTSNGGAGRVNQDGESSSDDGLTVNKSKKKRKGELTWTMMQGWVTGEEAVMKQENIDKEIHEGCT